MRKRILIAGFACASLVNACGSPNDDPAVMKARLREEYEIFERLRSGFPQKARGDVRCPDEEFAERIKSPGNFIPVVDFEHLSYYTSERPRADNAWRFLRTPGPRRLPALSLPIGPARTRAALLRVKRLRSQPYIMVIQAVRRLPVGKDERFQAGIFAGRLVIFDTRNWQPVCGAKVLAANSRLVRYRNKGMLAVSAKKAVLRDFRENVKNAVTESLARITKTARVKLY